MTTATWVTMIGILLFVWGGFSAALVVAVRKEGAKRRLERGSAPARDSEGSWERR